MTTQTTEGDSYHLTRPEITRFTTRRTSSATIEEDLNLSQPLATSISHWHVIICQDASLFVFHRRTFMNSWELQRVSLRWRRRRLKKNPLNFQTRTTLLAFSVLVKCIRSPGKCTVLCTSQSSSGYIMIDEAHIRYLTLDRCCDWHHISICIVYLSRYRSSVHTLRILNFPQDMSFRTRPFRQEYILPGKVFQTNSSGQGLYDKCTFSKTMLLRTMSSEHGLHDKVSGHGL